jgi:hypothetical protein
VATCSYDRTVAGTPGKKQIPPSARNDRMEIRRKEGGDWDGTVPAISVRAGAQLKI